MEKKNQNKIVVERETYEKDGKSYFSYFIKGNFIPLIYTKTMLQRHRQKQYIRSL